MDIKLRTLRERLSQLADSVGQYMVQGGFGSLFVLLAGFAIAYIRPPSFSWFAVIVFGLVLLLLYFWALSIRRIDIYANPESSPHIAKEIEKANEIWLSWHTGGVTRIRNELARESNGVKLGSKISKAILLDQSTEEGNYLPIHAGCSVPKIEASSLSRDIGEAINQLRHSDVEEIRTFNGPLAHLTFLRHTNPDKSKVRVEQWAPYLSQNERPIYYIKRRQFREEYDALERAFSRAWEHAESTQC